jgi:hypothetical protein
MIETAASDFGFVTRVQLRQALSQRSHGRLELDPRRHLSRRES